MEGTSSAASTWLKLAGQIYGVFNWIRRSSALLASCTLVPLKPSGIPCFHSIYIKNHNLLVYQEYKKGICTNKNTQLH